MRGWSDAHSLAFERGRAVKGVGRTDVPGRRIPLCVGGDTQAVLVNRTGGGLFSMASSRVGKALLVLLIAAVTVLASMVGSAIAAEGENDSRAITDKVQYEADPSTALNGRSILGTEGGRYAGRVWSDKSVYTDGSVDLGDGIRVEKAMPIS